MGRKKKMEEALFEPVNGQAKSVEKTIEFLKKRRAKAEELMVPFQREIDNCDSTIQALRVLLGQGNVPEELVDAVEESKRGQKGVTPAEPVNRRPGRFSAALYGFTTGIHAEEVVKGYVKDMRGAKFTSLDIRDRLVDSGQYPSVGTVQVTAILKKLCKERLIKSARGSRDNQITWIRAKVVTKVPKTKAPKRGGKKRKAKRPKLSGMTAELFGVIKGMDTKDGFTSHDVTDNVTNEVGFNSVVTLMGHLTSKGYIKHDGYDTDNHRVFVMVQ